MLVFFVGHMAGRINVDTVVQLVSDDVRRAFRRLLLDAPPPPIPDPLIWQDAHPVTDPAGATYSISMRAASQTGQQNTTSHSDCW